MSKPHREDALEKIRTSTKTRVILISFKAGSTGKPGTSSMKVYHTQSVHIQGLNLTCCNNVILVDLWWNPALEDQAFDRAHRLGQTRNVNIHKLSVPDTVEERILEVRLVFCGIFLVVSRLNPTAPREEEGSGNCCFGR